MIRDEIIEKHPFPMFVPKGIKYLILGSFVGEGAGFGKYIWFYITPKNQFWRIIEYIYKVKLDKIEDKKIMFRKLKIGLTDIIFECGRKRRSNSDSDIINITYNIKGINKIFMKNKIEKVYFTSRFVENMFFKEFFYLNKRYASVKFITLPSPSPRNAKISFKDKVVIYKKLLPRLNY